MVGTGLAGASASATLAELGYNIKSFCINDTPRRAHSIAAQGGINAAKNYPGDGDSVKRLFYDTIKGGDFRAREANVYRLAQLSNLIIDHCVALGVPFAREYGGLLDNRSFGGAQVSRTFYARGQTGQQLLLGAYSSMMRQVASGGIAHRFKPRNDGFDCCEWKSKGHCYTRRSNRKDRKSPRTCGGSCQWWLRQRFLSFHQRKKAPTLWPLGGVTSMVLFLPTLALLKFIPPAFLSVEKNSPNLLLMSESLRNDGRVWVPEKPGDHRPAHKIPESERDYYLERIYPSFGNLMPRDVASRQAKFRVDEQKGVGPSGKAVYLDFKDAIEKQGRQTISAKYGNLFQMYEQITGEDPYKTPMRIYPAVHYTMGGLWVDYNLQSNIEGLFVLGRGKLFRPWSQQVGSFCSDAGSSGRIFCHPLHPGRLPCLHAAS